MAVAPFGLLAKRLELTGQEVDALWLLACCELDPAVARLANAVAGSELSVMVWMRLVEIATGAALRAEQLDRLVELVLVETTHDPRTPASRRSIRINDRVLELARGEVRLDRELAGVATITVLDDSSDCEPALTASPSPIIVAVGPDGHGRRTLLRAMAARVARGALEIEVGALSTDPTRQLRAIRREACLFGFIPILVGLSQDGSECMRMIDRDLLARHIGPILATARSAPSWISARPVVVREVGLPSAEVRASMWRSTLPAAGDELVRTVAESYAISPGAIVATAASALAQVGGEPSKVTQIEVHEPRNRATRSCSSTRPTRSSRSARR